MLRPFYGRESRHRTTAPVLAAIVVAVMAVPCIPLAQTPPEPPPVPPADGEPPAAPTAPQTSPPKADAAPAAADAGARKVAGRVRGMVSDMAKKPLAGLLVTLSSRSEPGILRVTGTNEKGLYVFQELPPGSYDLKVQAPGYVDAGKEAVEIKPPFQNVLDVMLQRRAEGSTPAAGSNAASPGPGTAPGDAAPPVTVRGRFVTQEKRPLAEVSVLFSAHEGRRIYQAFSSSDGAFEVTGIIPGLYRVIVRSPGHVPLDLKSVEILKDNGLSVSLMLVDYPLNFKAGKEPEMPPEAPRAATPPALPEPVEPAPDAP